MVLSFLVLDDEICSHSPVLFLTLVVILSVTIDEEAEVLSFDIFVVLVGGVLCISLTYFNVREHLIIIKLIAKIIKFKYKVFV